MDKLFLLEKIQTARKKRFINNFYSVAVVEQVTKFWALEDNFLFSYQDHGVERLIFFVDSWKKLDTLLDYIEQGSYFLEFITKNPDEYLPQNMAVTARMMRLVNSDCNSVFNVDSPVLLYKDSVLIEEAHVEDSEEINQILWNTFSTEISHLLEDNEIKARINQFFIHRNVQSNKIDALLQANVMPKRFYINQIVNKAEKNVAHALLLSQLEKYVAAGGKYLFAWVEENNIASQKFHAKYGMKPDGFWSLIFSMER